MIAAAGATGATGDWTPVFVWCFILIVVVLIGFFVATWLRKRLNQADDQGIGFSLAELREMRNAGKLSQEEFERAKTRLTAGLKRTEKPRNADEKSG